MKLGWHRFRGIIKLFFGNRSVLACTCIVTKIIKRISIGIPTISSCFSPRIFFTHCQRFMQSSRYLVNCSIHKIICPIIITIQLAKISTTIVEITSSSSLIFTISFGTSFPVLCVISMALMTLAIFQCHFLSSLSATYECTTLALSLVGLL